MSAGKASQNAARRLQAAPRTGSVESSKAAMRSYLSSDRLAGDPVPVAIHVGAVSRLSPTQGCRACTTRFAAVTIAPAASLVRHWRLAYGGLLRNPSRRLPRGSGSAGTICCDECELIPVGAIDRVPTSDLRARQINAVHPDAGKRAIVVVAANAFDCRRPFGTCRQGAFRSDWIARSAVATLLAVAWHFWGVDTEKSDTLGAATKSVAVDGDQGTCKGNDRHAGFVSGGDGETLNGGPYTSGQAAG